MAKQRTTHGGEVPNLRRIEGQIRGIIRMIEEKRYCVDIMLQLSAVKSALSRVEERVLENHIRGCLVDAFRGGNQKDKDEKIKEVIGILAKFRRTAR